MRKDDRVRITVNVPDKDPEPDIFVAGDGAVTFGMSKLKTREANSAVFSAPYRVPERIKSPSSCTTHWYKVDRAVSGTIDVHE